MTKNELIEKCISLSGGNMKEVHGKFVQLGDLYRIAYDCGCGTKSDDPKDHITKEELEKVYKYFEEKVT